MNAISMLRPTKELCALLLCSTVVSLVSAAQATKALPIPTGIWVVESTERPADNADAIKALARPDVDGVFLKVTWRDLEPEDGRYDWTFLDSQIRYAASLHKTVSIAVAAGIFTPDWVYKAGAASFTMIGERRRQKNFCQPSPLPLPWDPVFLASWTKMIQSLGERYTGNPAVVMVKFGGFNDQTWELILPHKTGGERVQSFLDTTSCVIPDDVKQWKEKGYTSTKMIAAFRRILNAYADAFPNQRVAMMTGTDSLPPLGTNGEPDAAAASLPETVFQDDARKLLGTRFVEQANNLSAPFTDPLVVKAAQQGITGFQAAWPATGDSNCFMNKGTSPCQPVEVMQRALGNAVKAKVCYLELFPKDIFNPEIQPIIDDAREQIRAHCSWK